MPYEYVIADCDASLILKAASAVEEDVFSDRYIFPAVSIKGREKIKTFIYFFFDEFRKNFSQVFRSVVTAVELCSKAAKPLEKAHACTDVPRNLLSRFPTAYMVQKFFDIHYWLFSYT